MGRKTAHSTVKTFHIHTDRKNTRWWRYISNSIKEGTTVQGMRLLIIYIRLLYVHLRYKYMSPYSSRLCLCLVPCRPSTIACFISQTKWPLVAHDNTERICVCMQLDRRPPCLVISRISLITRIPSTVHLVRTSSVPYAFESCVRYLHRTWYGLHTAS